MRKILLGTFLFFLPLALFSDILTFRLGSTMLKQESDLWQINRENLYLKKNDFNGKFFSGEFEFRTRKFKNLSFSFEYSSYERSKVTSYRDYEYSDGSPITQTLKLKITPLEINMKYYPLGLLGTMIPYFGAGTGIYFWNYQQEGDFIDFNDYSIFTGSYNTSTQDFGANLRAGLIFKISNSIGLTGDAKYIWLKGKLSDEFQGFEKFDLNGFYFSFGISFLF
ncbi:MAG: hypothetical protein AB1410_09370 [Acidobacteriota bacterium]